MAFIGRHDVYGFPHDKYLEADSLDNKLSSDIAVCSGLYYHLWLRLDADVLWHSYSGLPCLLQQKGGRFAIMFLVWVGIGTRYELDGPGIESRWGRDFQHQSRPALGSTQPPVQCYVAVLRQNTEWMNYTCIQHVVNKHNSHFICAIKPSSQITCICSLAHFDHNTHFSPA
jgi:hypothetical protein